MVLDWIGNVVAGVSSVLTSNTELKKVKAEGKIKLEQARIQGELDNMARSMETEGNYDLEAQRQMQHSIKDEILMIVLFLPFVVGFLPIESVQDSITAGWTMLATAPLWYPFLLIGITCSVFGLRWYASKIPK